LSTLRNPVHIGMLRDGRSVRLGCHPATVSDEVFNAAGKALDARRTLPENVTRYGPVWLLRVEDRYQRFSGLGEFLLGDVTGTINHNH
jgi:hypothetical protein